MRDDDETSIITDGGDLGFSTDGGNDVSNDGEKDDDDDNFVSSNDEGVKSLILGVGEMVIAKKNSNN